MDNPAGYLYRVAQTGARREIRLGRFVELPPESAAHDGGSALDVDLTTALLALRDRHRLAVVMICVYGWTPSEIAALTGASPSTVRSHLRRGLRHLRRALTSGVSS